jgi:hypothetical protein
MSSPIWFRPSLSTQGEPRRAVPTGKMFQSVALRWRHHLRSNRAPILGNEKVPGNEMASGFLFAIIGQKPKLPGII